MFLDMVIGYDRQITGLVLVRGSILAGSLGV